MSVQVISFNCLLKNKAGKLISSTFNSEVLNIAENQSDVLTGLVLGLQNIKTGEHRKISLTAEQAYGLYDPRKVIFYPRKKLPSNLRNGEVISIVGKSGTSRSYKVVQFHDDMVSLDGNHPLAGQDLIFEIEVLSARDATREEIGESSVAVSAPLLH